MTRPKQICGTSTHQQQYKQTYCKPSKYHYSIYGSCFQSMWKITWIKSPSTVDRFKNLWNHLDTNSGNLLWRLKFLSVPMCRWLYLSPSLGGCGKRRYTLPLRFTHYQPKLPDGLGNSRPCVTQKELRNPPFCCCPPGRETGQTVGRAQRLCV